MLPCRFQHPGSACRRNTAENPSPSPGTAGNSTPAPASASQPATAAAAALGTLRPGHPCSSSCSRDPACPGTQARRVLRCVSPSTNPAAGRSCRRRSRPAWKLLTRILPLRGLRRCGAPLTGLAGTPASEKLPSRSPCRCHSDRSAKLGLTRRLAPRRATAKNPLRDSRNGCFGLPRRLVKRGQGVGLSMTLASFLAAPVPRRRHGGLRMTVQGFLA
jgi:hypothetical protein